MVVGKVAFSNIYKTFQTRRPALPFQRTSISRIFSSQSDSGDQDNEGGKKAAEDKVKDRTPNKQEAAKSRLDGLLKNIIKEQQAKGSGAAGAKPPSKKDIPAIEFRLAKPVREKPPPPTEEEVLAATEDRETSKEIGKEMLSAVKTVAKSVEGDPKVVESELVQKLKSHAPGKINLNELFEGMKIDKPDKPRQPIESRQGENVDPDLSRAHRVRRVLEDQRPRGFGGRDRFEGRSQQSYDDRGRPGFSERRPRDQGRLSYAPIDLFGAPPLNIFTASSKTKPAASAKPGPNLKTWDALYAKELKLATTHPPANGFEEMIMWTEQGKLWHYPIDNEQGLDLEAKVSFHEHIFLEPHIEGWCPPRGPIRHFMELVCVGLSKNPFLTIQEKKDHLEWYHEYFKVKADIIKEVGAGEIK